MTNPIIDRRSAIQVLESLGEWFVTVKEDGVGRSFTFDDERLALCYAEQQRARLNITAVERI